MVVSRQIRLQQPAIYKDGKLQRRRNLYSTYVDILKTARGKRITEIVKKYNKVLEDAVKKGDLSKAPSFEGWLRTQKYNMSDRAAVTQLSARYPQIKEFKVLKLFDLKRDLIKKLVTEANRGERFVDIGEILSKVQDSSHLGLKKASERKWLRSILHSQEDKVHKIVKNIIEGDQVIPPRHFKKGQEFAQFNPFLQNIKKRLGEGNRVIIKRALESSPLYKKYAKELQTAAYANLFAPGLRFSEVIEDATNRMSGGVQWSFGKGTRIVKDPSMTIYDFALRHWDTHNKNKTGNSQIEFYKKGSTTPLKWAKVPVNKNGIKSIKPSTVYFTFSNDPSRTKWSLDQVRKSGRASGLFDEVYNSKLTYDKLLTELVPNPTNPEGRKIKFGQLMKAVQKKGFGNIGNPYAIDHIKGVANEPFSSLRVVPSRLNSALDYINRHVPQKNFKKILMNALDLQEVETPLEKGQQLAKKVLVKGYKTDLTAAQELAHTVLGNPETRTALSTPQLNKLVGLYSKARKFDVVKLVLDEAALPGSSICKRVFGKGVRFGLQAGGFPGGCAIEMAGALKKDSVGVFEKISKLKEETGALGKIRNTARGFLGVVGKFAPTAGKYGAIVAAGAVAKPAFDAVRQFVNDDPSTYLTDPEQMERMLLSTIEAQERKKPRSEILDWGIGAAGVGATAAAVPGTGALWKARRLPFKREATLLRKGIDKAAYGMPRAALGPAMKLISGMYTPAGLLAAEPLRIAQMRRQGEDWGEIAQDPTLWMGPAFAPSMTKLATAGMKSKPLLAKALRLGMSPGALKVLGRTGGIGLLASLGLTGYDKYKDWKNKRGWFAKD